MLKQHPDWYLRNITRLTEQHVVTLSVATVCWSNEWCSLRCDAVCNVFSKCAVQGWGRGSERIEGLPRKFEGKLKGHCKFDLSATDCPMGVRSLCSRMRVLVHNVDPYTAYTVRNSLWYHTGGCETNIPPKKTGFQSTKSLTGMQFLLVGYMAKALIKGVPFHRLRYGMVDMLGCHDTYYGTQRVSYWNSHDYPLCVGSVVPTPVTSDASCLLNHVSRFWATGPESSPGLSEC